VIADRNTTQVWSEILVIDVSTIDGQIVHVVGTATPPVIAGYQTTLWGRAKVGTVQSYITNTGSGWTKETVTAPEENVACGVQAYSDINLVGATSRLYSRPLAGGGFSSTSWTDTIAGNKDMGTCWRNLSNGSAYIPFARSIVGTTHAFLKSSAGDEIDLGAHTGTVRVWVSGALMGNQVYTVRAQEGKAHLSDDGVTFSELATWLEGVILDAKLGGGGTLVWGPVVNVSSGNVPLRLYNRNGTVLMDATGNFWTECFPSDPSVGLMGWKLFY
jgi:hypothetical protein